jgi:hypothetical protein
MRGIHNRITNQTTNQPTKTNKAVFAIRLSKRTQVSGDTHAVLSFSDTRAFSVFRDLLRSLPVPIQPESQRQRIVRVKHVLGSDSHRPSPPNQQDSGRASRPEINSPTSTSPTQSRGHSPMIASVGNPAFITGIPKFVHTHVGGAGAGAGVGGAGAGAGVGGAGAGAGVGVGQVVVAAPTGRQRIAAAKAHHHHNNSPARRNRPRTPIAHDESQRGLHDDDNYSNDVHDGAGAGSPPASTHARSQTEAIDSAASNRHPPTAVRVKLTLNDQRTASPTDADFWESTPSAPHSDGPMEVEFRLAVDDWIGVCESIAKTLRSTCRFENEAT